ncbi:DUF305 domain-containing protein [Ktedonobacter racemifer]|uniref:DUF305 domain-containing protein n=1 Tax=Ktedonobacter racemifer DSM 44963 TaxID=485913 RepID=D6TE50_KTERA|nr:DUF305 domain-containing protein [Ktedonobacter racemifer]EFH88423.1 protein of unknown function DUF305 [Ktedonobacter racemifer DSM 44963]
MKKPFRILPISSFFLLLLLAACGGTTSNTNTMPGMDHSGMKHTATITATSAQASTGTDPMTENLKPLSGKDFEIKFMQEMIVHHQSAIDMAQLVPSHTKRPELNTLSANIIKAQTSEIGEMKQWLKQWYNEQPLTDTMSVPGMMDMMGSMDMLKNAKDTDFDKQFATMMIQHHQQAINMAKLLPEKTQRPELVTLGQNIVSTQSQEVQQMQSWQKEWFKA